MLCTSDILDLKQVNIEKCNKKLFVSFCSAAAAAVAKYNRANFEYRYASDMTVLTINQGVHRRGLTGLKPSPEMQNILGVFSCQSIVFAVCRLIIFCVKKSV